MDAPDLINNENNEGNGKYIIDPQQKAESTNSIVREGEHQATGENVIIKEIKLETQSHKEVFKNEVYLLGKLSECKYIVKAYSSFILNGSGFIIMEKVESDLLSLISEKPLKEHIAKSIFHQIVLGLHFMHEHRVCHRDIKPENILVQRILGDKEPYYQVKLCDFGSACEWKSEDKTVTGVQGTLMYVAPEVKKRLPYNPQKADIYSLGILLHVILTALFPYDSSYGKNPSLSKEPEIIFSRKLPSDAKDLLKKMLYKKPSSRIEMRGILNHEWLREVSQTDKRESRFHPSHIFSSFRHPRHNKT